VKLALVVTTEDVRLLYSRFVEREYSRVPAAGEMVPVDDEGVHPLPVAAVYWLQIPVLAFLLHHDEATLIDFGFHRVEPGTEIPNWLRGIDLPGLEDL
jgi:hypothetical protein